MSKWHKILDIPENSNVKQVAAAYRKKATQCHPDVCKDPDAGKRFIEINTAYRVLTDSTFEAPKPTPPPKPKPKPKYKPYHQPKPKVDIWGDVIDEDEVDLWAQFDRPRPRPLPIRVKPEPVKEVDLWAQQPKNPMAGYWKEYNKLRKEMAYETPDLFWKKLDEWQKKNEN